MSDETKMEAEVQRAERLAVLIDNEQPGQSEMLEANSLVNGDRQASYGPPRNSYEALAKMLSGLLARKLKSDLTPEDVALVMLLLKVQRESYKPKRDNRVDMHGYLLVLAHIIETAP